MNSQHPTATVATWSDGALYDHRLPGRWLTVARVAWIVITFLTFGLFLAGIPARFEQLLAVADKNVRVFRELGLSADLYASYFTILDLIIVLVHMATASVIFWRKSTDWVALFVSLTLVTAPIAVINALVTVPPAWGLLVSLVTYIGIVFSIGLLYLFPDGRFVPGWTRPLAIGWAVVNVPAIFFPTSPLSFHNWPILFQAMVLVVAAAGGVYSQIYRYVHVSNPTQQQQIKWAVLGLTAAVLGPFGYFLPFITLPSLSQPNLPSFFYYLAGPALFRIALIQQIAGFTLFTFGALLFPLSFTIAVLRYRLFDIDIFINRTLVYGSLTAALALVYVSSVVVLEGVFRLLTGQGSNLAIVGSTLAIAALFNPMRARIQAFIDRRFYRRKYDAEQVLAAFGSVLRDEVDLDRLTVALIDVVQETMQPAHVSLWLRQPERQR